MSIAFDTEIHRSSLAPISGAGAASRQPERIRAALGLRSDRLSLVDEETLSRYYDYLSAHLSLPFAAYYPEPTNSQEVREYHCEVIELIDPATYLSDEFDGIFCKTRKGTCQLNLPLIDLHLPEDNPNFQLIEDYWYWFWNWR
jgi:hypothetical protein